jgi:hypothetical protein
MKLNHSAGNGCIILGRDTRQQIIDSDDLGLVVVVT